MMTISSVENRVYDENSIRGDIWLPGLKSLNVPNPLQGHKSGEEEMECLLHCQARFVAGGGNFVSKLYLAGKWIETR